MKTPITITLIIMGALLVLAPPISDMLYQRHVIALLAKSGVTKVTLLGQMSELYRFGCWITGSGMVGIAVLASLVTMRRTDETGVVAQRA